MMRDEFTNHDREALLKELEAARLRLAFHDEQVREIEAIEESCQTDEALQARLRQARPEVMRLIDRGVAQRKKQRVAPVVLKVAKVAACLLLAAYIGLSSAMAFSQAARLRIQGLFVKTERGLTTFGLGDDWQSIEVPDGWHGEYYPAYVPEGFTLHFVHDDEGASFSAEYLSPDQRWYVFDESTENSVSSITTKNARMTEITIHDRPALLVEAPDVTMVVWAEFNKWFSVTTWTDVDIIPIARSVTRVK